MHFSCCLWTTNDYCVWRFSVWCPIFVATLPYNKAILGLRKWERERLAKPLRRSFFHVTLSLAHRDVYQKPSNERTHMKPPLWNSLDRSPTEPWTRPQREIHPGAIINFHWVTPNFGPFVKSFVSSQDGVMSVVRETNTESASVMYFDW